MTITVTIGQPTRGALDLEHLRCFEALREALRADDRFAPTVVSRVSGCSLVDHARSLIATEALHSGTDVLLWIDDDMLFEPAELIQMCIEAHTRAAVVGAVAPVKKMGGELNTKFLPGTTSVRFFKHGTVLPVQSIGTGIMAVGRAVLRDVARALFEEHGQVNGPNGQLLIPFHQPMVANGSSFGEDMSFCIRATAVGAPIYADTRVRTLHKGTYAFGVEESALTIKRYDDLRVHLAKPVPPGAPPGAPPDAASDSSPASVSQATP